MFDDDPAVPLSQTSVPSMVGDEANDPIGVCLTASEPRKKDLSFTMVESSPPTQTDSLALVKLSQYVEEPCSSSSRNTVGIYDFEVHAVFAAKQSYRIIFILITIIYVLTIDY